MGWGGLIGPRDGRVVLSEICVCFSSAVGVFWRAPLLPLLGRRCWGVWTVVRNSPPSLSVYRLWNLPLTRASALIA